MEDILVEDGRRACCVLRIACCVEGGAWSDVEIGRSVRSFSFDLVDLLRVIVSDVSCVISFLFYSTPLLSARCFQ